MPIYLPVTGTVDATNKIPLNIFDINQSPPQLWDFTQQYWNAGTITLTVTGMGDRFSFNETVWNAASISAITASTAAVSAGKLLLANTAPNLTITLPANDANNNPLFKNFPSGEYLFQVTLISSTNAGLTAYYSDILYVLGAS